MFGPSRRDLHRALERERLRNQQREGELLDRLMFLSGRTWALPPVADDPEPQAEPLVGALDVLPEEWHGSAAQHAEYGD